MKYIMFKCDRECDVRYLPIIFPHFLIHDTVANAMKPALEEAGFKDAKPISAGECNFIGDEVNCSGASSTLKLESRYKLDDEIIRKFNYFHGVDMNDEDEFTP